MQILRRAGGSSRRIAVLSGTFNPPTRAHLALATASLTQADEALLVLPRTLPHKSFEGAALEQRIEMLLQATEGHPLVGVALSDGGLFIEIARECKVVLGPETDVRLICGRDAAERIVGWDYSGQAPIEAQLTEYSMLVAARQGTFRPPERLAARITSLALSEEFDWHSASEVRRRIGVGEAWEMLVPVSIVPLVRKFYGC